ncbi:MAG: hypothetical protein FJ272_23090, partial [Planctomycetes bacterium]|nr:hypothetical protein [Planctomycetota bacterium]
GTGQAANLARTAKVKASSEYDQRYQARFAVDGQIPAGDSKADVSKAWAVLGSEARHQARFMLEWDKPVKVGEIVYYGRTAWLATECWKDYEVYLDDAAKPVAKGKFEIGSGPQRIKLQPADVRKITIKFLSSHGGINPGASEIEVYEVSPPESALPKFVKYVPPQEKPWAPPADSPELAALVKEGRLGFDELLLVKRHELNPSHVYTAYCEGFKPGGGLYALSPPRPDGQLTELLASPQGQILDVDLSCDGREIVFSWRKNAAVPYRLFRMNVDGSGLTQLTDGAWHDYNACWLPDGGIAFCSTRASVFALCFTTPSGVLYRMDRDGGNVQRLSANYVNDFTPSVLPDGRILYCRWEYVDKPAIPIQSLWTIHPDGTNLRVFYGNRVLSPASFLEARPIPGTQQVMCTLTAHNGPIRGGVGVLDVRHGVNAQDAIVNLTPEVDIGQVDKGSGNHVKGPYEQPYPLDDNLFLVSGKGIVLVGDVTRRWAMVCRSSDALGFYSPTPLRSRPK